MSESEAYQRRVRLLLRASALLMVMLAGLIFFSLWWVSQQFRRPIPNMPMKTWAVQPGKTASTGTRPMWNSKGIADFELIDQHGNHVNKSDLLGSPWVVCFIFTRCAGKCPLIIQQVDKVHDRLKGETVRFVAISVDPEFDTPETLRKYARLYGANSDRWIFLTGSQEKIHRLIRESFQMPLAETFGKDRIPGFEFVHSLHVLLVDSNGRVAGKFNPQDEIDLVRLRHAIVDELKNKEAEEAPSSNSDE